MDNLVITPITTQLAFKANKFKHQEELDKSMNKLYLAEGGGVAVVSTAFLAYRGYNSQYKVKLAKDLTKELGQKITTKHLKSVMSKAELLKELPKLKEQNYVASLENIKNGTFLADLHSHSNYSDGKITVQELLNQAVEYGNKLQKINGKKFIFALSDHDGVEGVKEALKIIAKDPEKFVNIKFVPASEISFILPSQKNSTRFKKFQTDVQMPEMLVYGINPFSDKSVEFFNSIYRRRLAQIKSAVDKVNFYFHTANLSIEEFLKYFSQKDKKLCFLNQHWKIWDYVHTKHRVVEMAKEQNLKPDVLYEQIINELKLQKKQMNPYELNEYIKQKNIQTSSAQFNKNISEILETKIFPKKESENIATSDFEQQLKDIAQYSKDENALLGFAHPAFTMQNFNKEQILECMQNLIKECKGRIKFAEKYHQAYPVGKEIEEAELREYNDILDKLNLILVGGRDNHSDKFIPY